MTQKASTFNFPKNFYWGASVSAHQVEGGQHNQWSVWEFENARALAEKAKYRANYLPKWEEVKAEASMPENYVSDRAVDHYNLYKQDVAALKKLHMNAFRFSIEWSRLEPEEGRWDPEALEHYRNYLRVLKENDIEPFVTLFHWTLPVWFAKKGGFEKHSNIKYFLRFADKVLHELGQDFRYLIPLNEPEAYVNKSYYLGEWPPQQQSRLKSFMVYRNLIDAHKKIYRLARLTSNKFIVGIAKNCVYNYPGDDAWITRLSAWLARLASDDFILGKIKKQLDFIGVNYYFSSRFYGYRIHNPDLQLSDLGWDMQPQDIQFVLERLYDKYGLPLIVTENGCADRADASRKWWITQTLVAMNNALDNGVQLHGYLHWSLLDNFEWSSGFWPKFGLLSVDRSTMKRTARPSAVWFAGTLASLRQEDEQPQTPKPVAPSKAAPKPVTRKAVL